MYPGRAEHYSEERRRESPNSKDCEAPDDISCKCRQWDTMRKTSCRVTYLALTCEQQSPLCPARECLDRATDISMLFISCGSIG